MKKKKKFTKQTAGNKPKIKHVTDYSSCKIKYFSAYLVQSIVIKFILPLSRKNCTKRKFHQTKICFTRSFSSITNAHTHVHTYFIYCLSPRIQPRRGSNFFIPDRDLVSDIIGTCYARTEVSSPILQSPWERVNISRGKLGSCTAARVKSRVFYFRANTSTDPDRVSATWIPHASLPPR